MQNHSTHDGSSNTKWVVLKFGGSSVGEAKHWETISTQVESNISKGLKPLLVLSALKNVSNLLEALLHQALAGVHPIAIEHLKQHHLSFSAQLGLDIIEQLTPWFVQLESDCGQIYQSKKITPKLHASVLSLGELLSSTIGAEYLKKHFRNTKDDNFWFDARNALTAKKLPEANDDQWHHFTSAECNYQFDARLIEELASKSCPVIVTQGFIASDINEDTVLLGREGSDTSAAYFGALLNAEEIQVWTDVPGVFSCNPQENNQARQLAELNYSDAKQMAKFGAKVLHPRAIQPACDNSIPLFVKSTHLPMEEGTRIDKESYSSPRIKAVVNEPKVISISYAIKFESFFENTNHQLLSLGYDLVLKQANESENQTIIYRYNNSDKMEPDTSALLELIRQEVKIDKLVLSGNLSLLSVIGTKNDSGWQKDIMTFCRSQKYAEPVELFTHLQQGRVNLVIANDELQQWDKLLHKEFVENEEVGLGKPWLSFL